MNGRRGKGEGWGGEDGIKQAEGVGGRKKKVRWEGDRGGGEREKGGPPLLAIRKFGGDNHGERGRKNRKDEKHQKEVVPGEITHRIKQHQNLFRISCPRKDQLREGAEKGDRKNTLLSGKGGQQKTLFLELGENLLRKKARRNSIRVKSLNTSNWDIFFLSDKGRQKKRKRGGGTSFAHKVVR